MSGALRGGCGGGGARAGEWGWRGGEVSAWGGWRRRAMGWALGGARAQMASGAEVQVPWVQGCVGRRGQGRECKRHGRMGAYGTGVRSSRAVDVRAVRARTTATARRSSATGGTDWQPSGPAGPTGRQVYRPTHPAGDSQAGIRMPLPPPPPGVLADADRQIPAPATRPGQAGAPSRPHALTPSRDNQPGTHTPYSPHPTRS